MAEDAGALLVRSGLIGEEQLLIARQAQAGRGGTIGEHLVLAGFIDDEALADFYRVRLMVPQVSGKQLARISNMLIGKIPADMATEFRCVPVAFDQDQNLTVAMADPSATHTVDEIAFSTGHYVVRAVATQSQIAWCLAHYYAIITPLGQKLLDGTAATALPGPMPVMSTRPGSEPGPVGASTPPLSFHGQGEGQGQIPRSRSITTEIQTSRRRVMPPMAGGGYSREGRAESPRLADGVPTPIQLPLLPSHDGDEPSPELGEADDLAGVSGPVPVIIEPDPSPPRPPPLRVRPEGQQRVISFLREDTAPTGPMKTMSRPEEIQPPELEARAGELDVPTGPIQILNEPLPPVMIALARDSQPLRLDLLEPRLVEPEYRPMPLPDPDAPTTKPIPLIERQPRAERAPDAYAHISQAPEISETVGPDGEEPHDSLILLDRPKGKSQPHHRRARETQLGVGAASSRSSLPPGSTPASGVPTATPEQPTAQMDADSASPYPGAWRPLGHAGSSYAARDRSAGARGRHEVGRDTGPEGVPVIIDDTRTESTGPYDRRHPPLVDDDDPYEGWGPPGTTIPPPFLGALHHDDSSGPTSIPIITNELPDDSSPAPRDARHEQPRSPDERQPGSKLMARPMAYPGAAEGGGSSSADEPSSMEPLLVRELEDSSLALVEILRHLDMASSRDEVIDMLVDHLCSSHRRVAFFVVKAGRLSTWNKLIDGQHPDRPGSYILSLEEPSTFQDIVGTRLPFRGPITDSASRTFLTKTFGSAPAEMLCLPVAVRGRVVGVLYGDTNIKRVFEQHLAVVTRAAGVALERILKARKGADS